MASMKKPTLAAKAHAIAFVVSEELNRLGCKRLQICGSLRRKQPIVGDVDLVIESSTFDLGMKYIPGLQKVFPTFNVLSGKNERGFTALMDDVQVNVYIADEECWGAMILFLTGSKFFNIVIRGKAKKQGYKLNQYGLWHGEVLIAGRDERQIFGALGLQWLEPEQREKGTRVCQL